MSTSIIPAIRSECALPDTYAKGCALATTYAITSWQANEHNGYANLDGTARGSLGTYSVSVGLDLYENSVTDYWCNCPVTNKYGGMCKHCVALALTYLSSIDEPGSPYLTKPTKNMRKPADKAPSLPPIRTSPEIEEMVQAYASQTLKRTSRLVATTPIEGNEEPVELTCIISSAETAWRYSWSNSTWALGLKISRGKTSYIVKSVASLVNAWTNGTNYSYGKKLEFVHRHSAFTKRANALLEMLAPLVAAQTSLYVAQESRVSSSYYYDSPHRVPSKTLPLSSRQLIEVLDLMQGGQVIVESLDDDYYRSNRHKRTVRVTMGTPRLEVSLVPAREGSFDLTVRPGDFECILADDRLYLIGGKEVSRCDDDFAAALGTFCNTILPLPASLDALHIRKEDMPAFCSAVLPALRRHTVLDAPENMEDYLPAAPELRFSIGIEHGTIFCDALVRYATNTIGLFELVYENQVTRDVELELAAQQLVARYFPGSCPSTPNYGYPVPDSDYYRARLGRPSLKGTNSNPLRAWFYEDDDDAYYLLFAEGLRELSQLGEVMLAERLRNVTVRQSPQVRVDASVRSGLLDLQVSASDMSAAELATYLASYHRHQRFVRLDSGDLIRLDGSIAAVGELAAGLGMDADELVEGAHELPANRTLFVDALLKRASGVRFERNAAFKQIVRDFETVADADFVAPEQLQDVLRPYQTEGFRWLSTLGKLGFGGILADDMGLGKTLQAIAYLQSQRDQGESLPALIVCPASLVYNWRAEFEHFAPSMEVVAVTGQKQARCALIAAATDADVLVTSYDLLRRDIDSYLPEQFSCVVLDEAQYVKNHATKAAKAVRELRANVRFALTGTPIENRLLELWSIFDFLMPGVLGTADGFSKRFASPIGSGDEAAARRLQALVSPFILRRLKQDVAQDLPDKNESVVLASMEGEQDKLYRASATKLALTLSDQTPAEFAGQKLKILAELTKLRQLCCDPHLLYENYTGSSAKLETCMELVHQAIDGGHALLLFSQFTSMLEIIEKRLTHDKIAYLKLTGATSKEARVRLVEQFQAGAAPVFLISLKAGGTGLNLTAADIVIHYDPWWNLAAQNQATDRAHRIGQDKEVSVFKLIAKDTIEEKIVELQEAKRDLAEQVIGGETAGSSSITRDDLLSLLDQGI